MTNTSRRIENIALSGTMEIASKTIEMQNEGIDVINLCVGEPDFPTPDHIKEAAKQAIDENKTRYTDNRGLLDLRLAIIDKFDKECGVKFNLDEIIVSTGAKQALFNSLQTILSPGDEVILPLPYFVSYPHMVTLADGVPKYVKTKTENDYKITAAELRENITDKTKVLIICNPNNPSGAVYTKAELEALVEVALEYDLTIVSDEIYEKIIYDETTFTSLASLGEEIRQNTIIINGVSKAYAMTGWRIGYAIAPKHTINGMGKLQSHSTSCASSISQNATIAALTGSQECVDEQRKTFEKRKNLIVSELGKIDNISFTEPKGTFYIFVNIKEILEKSSTISTAKEFCMKLLNDAHVATVPGKPFGMEGYFRISYAKSMEELEKAMERISEAIKNIN